MLMYSGAVALIRSSLVGFGISTGRPKRSVPVVVFDSRACPLCPQETNATTAINMARLSKP
ncbi:protein of unknown function (plasmid) [Cupriavidus taiwanensis]|nr:protein of unknown function [Cupriavidus taiwanensis]